MTDLTINEAHTYLTTGALPANFRVRCEIMLQGARENWYACENCGGVRCMHMVLRDWHEGSGIDECDGMCCPDCGDFWRAEGGGK